MVQLFLNYFEIPPLVIIVPRQEPFANATTLFTNTDATWNVKSTFRFRGRDYEKF